MLIIYYIFVDFHEILYQFDELENDHKYDYFIINSNTDSTINSSTTVRTIHGETFESGWNTVTVTIILYCLISTVFAIVNILVYTATAFE